LETLVAWGARTIIFAGWCGAIDLSLDIGDLIVPDKALSGEGTSHYYHNQSKGLYPASTRMTDPLRAALSGEVSIHGGTIWTTDAIYRETETIVAKLQAQSILAVDMELAALLAVAKFRRVELAGVLTVSDHLGDFTWRPGFKTPAFKEANRHLVRNVAKWAKTEAQNIDTP
jgi:purine-nucleoside phosphorylase